VFLRPRLRFASGVCLKTLHSSPKINPNTFELRAMLPKVRRWVYVGAIGLFIRGEWSVFGPTLRLCLRSVPGSVPMPLHIFIQTFLNSKTNVPKVRRWVYVGAIGLFLRCEWSVFGPTLTLRFRSVLKNTPFLSYFSKNMK